MLINAGWKLWLWLLTVNIWDHPLRPNQQVMLQESGCLSTLQPS